MGNRKIISAKDMPIKNKAVFLDRDGVITSDVYYEQWEEWEAPISPEDVRLLPNVIEALSRIQQAGFLLFIVSNQGAYAKGKTQLESLLATEEHVAVLLDDAGINIQKAYYSYSHPQGIVKGFSGVSLERKPSPYFLCIAAATYGVDLSKSWMIGDRDTDILCGQAAGCRTLQILNPHAKITITTEPDFKAQTLLDAADILLNNS
jgi:D-glycero-D-manno-heptose 1,7-bisphosphate phosphatase